ncbi:MAG: FkbM family methyltransferase [Acidobacteriota bacterium]|nr:FkbM family methyltransferase [Acidobacteriota bacterium]
MSEVMFRPDTTDSWIFEEIHTRNEYRLPDKFSPQDVVIDVGAHIGIFTLAALKKGCRRVYSIEADAENYRIATANLETYLEEGLVRLAHAAVWRSDGNDDVLRFSGYPSCVKVTNTGGGDVIWSQDGPVVPKMSFDELVREAALDGSGRVRLVKLDCEGSEWPILYTSETLHLVEEICGEFHEIGGAHDRRRSPYSIRGQNTFTAPQLACLLESKGFQVSFFYHSFGSRRGMFFASRVCGVQ